ncbi:hypothetical protein ACP70R_009293 [Stipagrostis hirtigluma subsp. patula]
MGQPPPAAPSSQVSDPDRRGGDAASFYRRRAPGRPARSLLYCGNPADRRPLPPSASTLGASPKGPIAAPHRPGLRAWRRP